VNGAVSAEGCSDFLYLRSSRTFHLSRAERRKGTGTEPLFLSSGYSCVCSTSSFWSRSMSAIRNERQLTPSLRHTSSDGT
jgi:hypothetical protein